MKRLSPILLLLLLVPTAASAAGSCVADPTTLCLNDSRFAVTAAFGFTPDPGPIMAAAAVPLTEQAGYFWFFDSSNPEVIVKLLDGCPVNDHFWVFAAGLTNIRVILVVADTATGVTKTYDSPFATEFRPIQDIAAFDCP